MTDLHHPEQFLQRVNAALEAGLLLKITLSNYTGSTPELKNIYVRPVVIKREPRLSFTYRYKTRDIVKNHNYEDGKALLEGFVKDDFKASTLFSNEGDLVLQFRGQSWSLKQLPASITHSAPGLAHDQPKQRRISSAEKQYLIDLKLTDAEGNVFKNAQDKYKQINQYIEILHPMISSLPAGTIRRIADMGSGKGYLTFALYDYLSNTLNQEVQVTGVEFREDLVVLCNQISRNAGFSGLSFVQGSIEGYETASLDMLIALHACDTATDDAIYKGIEAGATLIVTAPCCHKQIRRAMTKGKASNELDFLTQHGIFLERQAEMVTDGLRALIMEHYGYQTKIMQFISDVHTPKNILIVGVKKSVTEVRKAEILKEIWTTKAFFGISYHHLEKLTGIMD